MKYTVMIALIVGMFSPVTWGSPDCITTNEDGTIKTRGVYETSEQGQVTNFTVYDGNGDLLYTEKPYYTSEGRIIRVDRYDVKGQLTEVVVYLKERLTILDGNGNFVRTAPYSESAFIESQEEK